MVTLSENINIYDYKFFLEFIGRKNYGSIVIKFISKKLTIK